MAGTRGLDGTLQVARFVGDPLRAFLLGAALLLAGSLLLPPRGTNAVQMAVSTAGVVILTVAVVRRRPAPRTAWWFVVAGGWSVLAATLVDYLHFGTDNELELDAVFPVAFSTVPFLLFVTGLALLSRSGQGRHGLIELLDAAMTALAGFLLLWVFFQAGFGQDLPEEVTAVAFPVGTLLILTVMVKLVLAGGLRDPAIRFVLLGVVVMLAITLGTVLPALKTATLHVWPGAGIGWPLIGVALGAAGLHRGLTYPRPGERATHGDRWPGRMVLFAVLVLVPPLAWASELTRPGVFGARTAQFLVPNIVSAVFLLLLVARLGLIARIAQQRADQLARHSTALATAVSEQDDLRRQLSHRDLHDPLTGLSNRVVLAERMEWALARRRGAGQHALILLDLDGFKDINDTLGHPVGDELLIEVAHRLVGHAPADATLARLGGDEFAVLLEETEPTASARWAETFRGALRRPYSIGGRDLFLTTSIGVRCTDPGQGATTPSDTLRDADLALYAAKEEGKDRVLIFYPGLRTARLDHTRISTGLRHALANDEFLLHYQPIVDLATDEVVAVEALIRWQPPGAALLPPADFIPVAEDTGLITPIGDWVLRRACHEARRWYEERDVAVSVNVSGRQLEDARFADGVFDALGEAGLPGRALILEITESNLVATAHGEALHGQLARLRAAGVRIAIDDFGTGYSSLSYVAQLPVDIVKIDKSFTQQDADVDFAPQDWAFTRAILQLVESLQMLAIAEGVETQSQADALRLLRCPLVQGFHFSRPMPASAVDRTLATSDRVGPGRDPAQTPPGSVRGSRTSRSGVR